jgi:hypothetical protein
LLVGEYLPDWLFYAIAAIGGVGLIAFGALGGGGLVVIVVGTFVLIAGVLVAVLSR